jgi:hypothetical protein
MRRIIFLLIALVVLALGFSAVAAQDATPIELGVPVEGEITNDDYELAYTFTGSAGDVVLIQMYQAPNATDYVDAYLLLEGPNGRVFAENDTDAAYYSQSTIVAELPEDGEYTIIATRYSGRTGNSVGEFILQANVVEPLEAGDKLEATIYGYSADERLTPNQYVIRGSGSVKIGFSQTVGDLFADIYLYPWEDGTSYPESVFELTDTSKLSSAVLTVELEEGVLYVLTVKDSFASSVFDDSSATVTITIG